VSDNERIVSELRAGLEGVTPGPWQVGSWRDMIYSTAGGAWKWICRVKRNEDEATDTNQDVIDAAHIARCDPDTIRLLLDELSRSREAEKRLKEALSLAFETLTPDTHGLNCLDKLRLYAEDAITFGFDQDDAEAAVDVIDAARRILQETGNGS